ncbi:MAG: glycerol kinase GlpK [Bifidobacteriaceae bacterium]|jgi:glycerol kinase|nr:glycerol kinase GlpK [Bifidobacteriaceae bacterium]
MSDFILALDQGTTSTRAIIFDHDGLAVATGQMEHRQIYPEAGWVEHDPIEIWDNTRQVIAVALAKAELASRDIAAIGITNQRETTVIWDKATGQPVYNAIVWQDARTADYVEALAREGGVERFRQTTGLPLNPYFSGTKIAWILDHVPDARRRAEAGELIFGTTDSWVLWNLTGGVDGGRHRTDVTNASRTNLMDLRTLDWHPAAVEAYGVPPAMLPQIGPSAGEFGRVSENDLLAGVPVLGILGDQQAATFGQCAFNPGDAKNTYGTGCFLLVNTGRDLVFSRAGLLTTVAYQLDGDEPRYALEGSIAVTGSLVQWLRDNLGLIKSAPQVEDLARSVADNGGAYIVPAFSGLFAPYWRTDARGVIVGLTRYIDKGHLARAALEATAYQTRDVLDAAASDGAVLKELRVDGGMIGNSLLMQFQADVLGVDVVRPVLAETTALGAAYAAGLAAGYWSSLEELRSNWREGGRWSPALDPAERERLYAQWHKAVQRSLDWV